jgi:hypothetical protein
MTPEEVEKLRLSLLKVEHLQHALFWHCHHARMFAEQGAPDATAKHLKLALHICDELHDHREEQFRS